MKRDNNKPFHADEGGCSCACTACENWRAQQVILGSLVTSAIYTKNQGRVELMATCWSTGGPLIWGEKLEGMGIVVAKGPTFKGDAHLDPVNVFIVGKGTFTTSAKWLIIL